MKLKRYAIMGTFSDESFKSQMDITLYIKNFLEAKGFTIEKLGVMEIKTQK